MSQITVAITMAGMGSRFRSAGYQVPKYRISALGKTLFEWSIESLRCFIEAGATFVFIVQRADDASDFILKHALRSGIKTCHVIEIDNLTDGQATTALMAQEHAPSEAPFVVYNIDTYIDPDCLNTKAIRGDGWIPCFDAPGDKWSFARVDKTNKVLELKEKERISSHATLGLYWFSSFGLYKDLYHEYFELQKNLDANERYIAPMYNLLIERNCDVYIESVPFEKVVALGTPEDVIAFDPDVIP